MERLPFEVIARVRVALAPSFSLKKRHSLSLSLSLTWLRLHPCFQSSSRNWRTTTGRTDSRFGWTWSPTSISLAPTTFLDRIIFSTLNRYPLSLFLSYIFVPGEYSTEFLICEFARWRCRPGSSRGCQRRPGWQRRKWPWPKELTTSRQRHPAS